mmetsp:Transcript_13605/g.29132  ORF Transcript_13605/g.29132 Transcript_13605/m.29132 type:complete len:216 (-) Transcript_13605:432-1079(-)
MAASLLGDAERLGGISGSSSLGGGGGAALFELLLLLPELLPRSFFSGGGGAGGSSSAGGGADALLRLLRSLLLGFSGGGAAGAGASSAGGALLRLSPESERLTLAGAGAAAGGGETPRSGSFRCWEEGREEGRPPEKTSPARTRCTTSAASPILQALPSICRKMLVFSGSRPATILSAFAGHGSPRKMETVLMILLRYATLASLSWMAWLSNSAP